MMGLTDRLVAAILEQCRKPRGLRGAAFGHWMARSHRPLTEWVVDLLKVQPDDHVLDVGCGSGMAIQILAGIASQGFVMGVDYSDVMVGQARQRNAVGLRARRVVINLGDVAALPYRDRSFDKVVAIETFCFWPEPVPNLKEVLRVLKPGGLIALAMEESKERSGWREPSGHTPRIQFPIYSGAELVTLLAAAGFSHAAFETDPGRGRGWLCALGIR